MVTYSYNAAKSTVRLENGIARINHYGPICPLAFAYLGERLIARSRSAEAVLARMDKAAFLLPEPPMAHAQLGTMDFPTSGLIVLPEQYEFWSAYARNLAVVGVNCAIFATSQIELAERWAQSLVI